MYIPTYKGVSNIENIKINNLKKTGFCKQVVPTKTSAIFEDAYRVWGEHCDYFQFHYFQ